MKFRKNPVVIEASLFAMSFPLQDGICVNVLHALGPHIHTLEGVMTVSEGDWIIKGIKGEFYPCKPDIFEATYEKVEEIQTKEKT